MVRGDAVLGTRRSGNGGSRRRTGLLRAAVPCARDVVLGVRGAGGSRGSSATHGEAARGSYELAGRRRPHLRVCWHLSRVEEEAGRIHSIPFLLCAKQRTEISNLSH